MKQPKISTVFTLFSVFFLLGAQPNPGPRSPTEANTLYEESVDQMKNSKWGPAASGFAQFIQRYPTDSRFLEAHLHLAESNYALKQYGEAAKALKEYLEEKSNNGVRMLLARAYFEMGKLSESRAALEETLKSKPEQEAEKAALLLKAHILSLQKRYADAKASLNAYVTAAHDSVESLDFRLMESYVKTRECMAATPPQPAKKEYEEKMMDFFHQTALCFKEALPIQVQDQIKSLSDSMLTELTQTWCKGMHQLETTLSQSKLDRFAKKKSNEDLIDARKFSESLQKEFTRCHEPAN